MASIPTDFSVTSALRKCLIANPVAPQDGARIVNPKNAPVQDVPLLASTQSIADILAPSIYTARDQADTVTPSLATAVTIPNTATAALLSALSLPVISVATELTPEAQPAIATASLATAESLPALALPSLATAQSVPTLATPSVATAVTGTQTAPNFPLKHPRILYDNLAVNYSLIISTTGTNEDSVVVPTTGDRWTFSSSGYVEIQLSSNVLMDTIAIGYHNLSDDGSSYVLAYSGNLVDPLVTLKSDTPDTNNPIMYHTGGATITVRRIRLTITAGSGSVNKFVGYISGGRALQLQRPFFSGHNPINDADSTEFYTNRTQSGNWVGREIRRTGYDGSLSVDNLDDTWYRTYIPAFKASAKIRPFFLAWNLDEYPDDVGFCFLEGDIRAPYNGKRKLRSLQFNYRGI